MKKWIAVVLISVCAAGTASAAWWPFGSDKKKDQAPAAPAPEMQRMHRPEGPGGKQPPQMTSEQKEKMKAQHEALMKLGDMARNETDPVKKEALVAELRAKVTELTDKMIADQKKWIEQAEAKLPKEKERLAEAEKNKADRIEKQVQRILAGEPPKRPEGKHPEGAPLKREGKKNANPPVTE